MLGVFKHDDTHVVQRLQWRACLFHQSKELRATPLAAAALESPTLSAKMKPLAAFWLASGLRRSSLLSLTRSSFPASPFPAATFLHVQIVFATTPTDSMVRRVPARYPLLPNW